MRSARPVIDSKGNVAYDPKHRKPKWVGNAELERFQKHEDKALSQEHTRNARIRIEDPFSRRPESNTIWDHIQAAEISAYIASQAYLEKLELPPVEVIPTPELLDGSLVHQELVDTLEKMRSESAKAMLAQARAEVQFRFDIGIDDPETNLKASPNWVANWRRHPTHIAFTRAMDKRKKKSRRRTLMRALACAEFEGSPEWYINYDPVATERRVPTEGMPPCFLQRYEELQEWRAIMERRADFDDHQPELGPAVLLPAAEFWASVAPWLREKVAWVSRRRHPPSDEEDDQQDIQDRSDMALLLYDLKYKVELQAPSLEWPPLRRPEPEEHQASYDRYFRRSPHDSRDLLQR